MEQAILKKIKQLRLDHNAKPQDIASYLNIDLSAYRRLESGETNTWGKYLLPILDFYQLSPSDFFKDIEGKNFVQHQENKDNAIGQVGGRIGTVNYADKTIVKSLLDQKDETIQLLKDKIAYLETDRTIQHRL